MSIAHAEVCSWCHHEGAAILYTVGARVASMQLGIERPPYACCSCRDVQLDYILNTHHHWDHVGGNEELKQRYGAQIVGPKADEARIPGIDVALAEGETWSLGDLEMRVFDTPGHTRGHITLWFPGAEVMFPGMLCSSFSFLLPAGDQVDEMLCDIANQFDHASRIAFCAAHYEIVET